MLRRSPIWSDPRVKPPYGSVEIDEGHPLAPRIVFMLDEGAGKIRALPNRQLSGTRLVIDPGWGRTTRGIGPTFSGANDDFTLESIDDAFYTMTAPFSIEVIWASASTLLAFGGIVSFVKAGQTSAHFADGGGTTTAFKPNLIPVSSGGVEQANWEGANSFSAPFVKQFVTTYDGTTGTIYADGVDQAATNVGTTGYGTGTNIRIGRSSFARQQGTVTKVALYPRVLTSADALELYAEPYAAFRPIIWRRCFVPAAVGGLQWKLAGSRASLAGRGGLAA